MGKHRRGGKPWERGGWQQGNGGGVGRGKGWQRKGKGFGLQAPAARRLGIAQAKGGGRGGGWAQSNKLGGGSGGGGARAYAPTKHAAREIFLSQEQGPPRWHQHHAGDDDDGGQPPVSDNLQHFNSGGRGGGGGGGGGEGGHDGINSRDLLSSAFEENSSRRRIEFHKATKSSTIFPAAGAAAAAAPAAASLQSSGGQQQQQGTGAVGVDDRGEGGKGAAGEGGGVVAGGVDYLGRLAERKIGLAPPPKELYPDFRVKACLEWQRVYRMGPGLRNLGNTCFLNATLQCLSYLPPLAQHLLKGLYAQGPQGLASRGPRPMGGFGEFSKVEILAAMEQHTKQVHQGQYPGLGAISPRVLVKNLRMIGKQFRQGRQEDAHEFLRHLLDKMVDCCLKRTGVKSSAPNRLAETTAIGRIFGGYLRSRLKCTKCGYCSDTFDHFMDLSMELSNGVRSVDVALKRFMATERLGSGNEWRCGGCKKPVQAEKSLSVFKPPNALVLQLKRFVFTRKACKIKDHVTFGDTLTLNVSGPERSAVYDLTGVVVHAGGSMSSGHYFAYVRSSAGVWHRMDDCTVSKALHRLATAKEAQSGLSRKHAAEEHRAKMSRAGTFWDRQLDMGKVKKVKEKKDPRELSPRTTDAFQSKQEQMYGQSRRGHR
eukprot:g16023.t1